MFSLGLTRESVIKHIFRKTITNRHCLENGSVAKFFFTFSWKYFEIPQLIRKTAREDYDRMFNL